MTQPRSVKTFANYDCDSADLGVFIGKPVTTGSNVFLITRIATT